MAEKSLSDRIEDVKGWLHDARERFWGARKNLREVRKHIKNTTKELRAVQERIKGAQGGVLDNLRAQEAKLKEKLDDFQKAQKKLADQVERRQEIEERLEKKLKYLKEKKEDQQQSPPSSGGGSGFSIPSRSWNPYGRNIPNWMIPWLDKSRESGWTGVVVSGVRTPEYSEQLCYNMCGAPSCPGRCAGRSSNHNMTAGQAYPAGALDVSDYYNFERIQWNIGSGLKNNLGAADPVHFSITGY